MDDCEEEAVRELQVEIVKRLDPTEYVLDYMFEEKGLTGLVYNRILNAENRIEMNRILLDVVKRKKLILLFLKALEYMDSHTNLALTLKRRIEQLKRLRLVKSKSETNIQVPIIFEINDKISKLTTKIEQFFKTLCHGGDLSRFKRMLSQIRSKFSHHADIQFCLLQVEISKSRVFYEQDCGQEDMIGGMEKLIPYTANPHVSCMVYLARKGSTIAMSGDLDIGLGHLQLARSKLQFVKPCKDTGMVLYIHINLLFEVYERHPTLETREIIIQNISEAIFHFSHESSLLREDYTRLFYLKMVFCLLGIGVFCSIIDCPVTEKDLKATESCLNTIMSIKGQFDKRRQMLYCVARSVLNKHRGFTFRAVELLKEAEETAKSVGFEKELKSIRELLKTLKVEVKAEEERAGDLEKELLRDLEEMVRDNLLTSTPRQLQIQNKCQLPVVMFLSPLLLLLLLILNWDNLCWFLCPL